MSAFETAAAVLATVTGLGAVVVDHVSRDGQTDVVLAGVAGAVTIGLAVLLFAGAVPNAKAATGPGGRAAETALMTSLVGFLSVASAWAGLPFVLGTGGAMLGRTARSRAVRPRQRGLALFSIALGVCAIGLGAVGVAI